MTDTRSSPVTEVLRLLQASTCFRTGSACGSLPCACAESLAALLAPAQASPDLIEDLASAMWEVTHDGRWDDPYCAEEQTKIIYRGDAEAALRFLGYALPSANRDTQ